MKMYTSAVIGLGAVGSATVYQLAKRGGSVLGIDRFDPPHTFGSSHGNSRITRQAIGEGAVYTPLSLRSYEIWRELEQGTGKKLLTTCGGLIISSEESTAKMHGTRFFQNTVDAARQYEIEHQVLTASEIRKRFPQFKVMDSEIGYYEPSAGYLSPEDCISAQLEIAKSLGADLHTNEVFLEIEQKNDLHFITTNKGKFCAERIIFTTGAWLPELFESVFKSRVKVYKQVMTWFQELGEKNLYHPDRCPVYIWEPRDTNQPIYGFPDSDGRGVKICTEYFTDETTASTVNREVSIADHDYLYDEIVRPYFNHIKQGCIRASACLYAVTEDFQFIIDKHPNLNQAWFASACSGHGFKHSAAIGEGLAQLALGEKSAIDFGVFGLRRMA